MLTARYKSNKTIMTGNLLFEMYARQQPSISNVLYFLPRDAMHKHGLCCRPVSVCPSVTLMDCIQTAEDIVKRFVHPGSHIILVF